MSGSSLQTSRASISHTVSSSCGRRGGAGRSSSWMSSLLIERTGGRWMHFIRARETMSKQSKSNTRAVFSVDAAGDGHDQFNSYQPIAARRDLSTSQNRLACKQLIYLVISPHPNTLMCNCESYLMLLQPLLVSVLRRPRRQSAVQARSCLTILAHIAVPFSTLDHVVVAVLWSALCLRPSHS